jgi:valyl-tRNA synthetase
VGYISRKQKNFLKKMGVTVIYWYMHLLLSQNEGFKMKLLPRKFNFREIEEKWQKKWEDMCTYHFDLEDEQRTPFSINTPPPYPSGEFHMGNVLNWTYFDIVARYKRMKGFNVFFPQGWDCHGLGIEVEVERTYNIKKRDIPSDEFRKYCEQTIEKYITMMKNSIIRLGCSIDWSTEYRTMDPNYWELTQLSFILTYEKGLIYKGTHPVNWCPRCETAIADAEVSHEHREGILHHIKFPIVNSQEYLPIATTRPELLPACVAIAVNPTDTRYVKHINQKISVPIVGREVSTISDETVQPSFGTGVVMICTYGDKADVKVVLKNSLPVKIILNKDGTINEKGGKYLGLSTGEAKKIIIKDLEKSNLLIKKEKIQQEVGVCERCGTPIEILEHKQWFMDTQKLSNKVLQISNEINWYPSYMKNRLIDWTQSLEWNWVISRQRVFGTPIPIWYCKNCGEIIIAEKEWVPIDPKSEKPKLKFCAKCGKREFIPETDVFDTWMDSSITCAVHAGWPNKKNWRHLFPTDLHPSGMDIIRTWAYYLIVRHLALFNQTPFKGCLINGMVLGANGRKMSKSLKNYVTTKEVLDKYGADAARQWAAGGGSTGSDVPFRWPDVEYSWRFLIKIWNASYFVNKQSEDYSSLKKLEISLQPLDRWVLSKTEKLIQNVSTSLEKYQFNNYLEELRNFVWHVFCDNYLESVKSRLYKPEIYGENRKKTTQYVLNNVLYKMLQLLAPITPYITEEIYQNLFAKEKGYSSIHLTPWPKPDAKLIDDEAEKNGDLIMALITEIRREKAQKRMPLNTKIKKITIYTEDKEIAHIIKESKDDISSTCKIEDLKILLKSGTGKEVKSYSKIHFVSTY